MKSIKKLLVVVMVLALMATYFVLPASAEEPYNISIAGEDIDVDNYQDVFDDGKVSYDPNTKTLTLDGATINATNAFIIDSTITQGLTIVVKGTCTITGGTSTYVGITNNSGSITITGDKDSVLNIDVKACTADPQEYRNGIFCPNSGSKITILDGVTVNVKSSGYGIRVADDVTIQDTATVSVESSLTGICSDSASVLINKSANVDVTSEYYGLHAKNTTIEDNATIKIISGYKGISANNITVDDNAKVDIKSDSSTFFASDNINFNGKINVNASTTNFRYCVLAGKEIVFNLDVGGKVTAETKNDSTDACAFAALSPRTIILNRDDGTDVTYPVGGKETKLNTEGDWAITESDGKTYAKKATVENKFVEYKIKESADEATWTKGGTTGQKITSTADFSKFVSVSVDGKVVDAANYTAASGSTVITFKPAFLETLSLGEHPVVITSKNGTATGTLIIKEVVTPTPETEKIADTADTNAIGAFVALGTIAAAGFVTLKKKEN